MAALESPGTYPESPLDEGDAVFPCKGCGEILEEGKAFELAGNRWHIDCFRCNTCGTLLDSDANLLLLGDGSLICNNCTYSCNACGNKIEDLAILTGDQAFCAACFRCRNCKRKIENLRYARTSQGIFCMSCHESLMARRRKKSKSTKQAAAGASAPVVLDKSLPALPPSAVPQSALSSGDTPTSEHQTESPSDRSPAPSVPSRSRGGHPTESLRSDVSPLNGERKKENVLLPASTYKQERKASVPSLDDSDGEDEQGGLLPLAFDPNVAPSIPPVSQKRLDSSEGVKKTDIPARRDYFTGHPPSKSSHREMLREDNQSPSRSASKERSGKESSPHVAYQEKNRQHSKRRSLSENNTPSGSAMTSPLSNAQEKLERPRPTQQDTGSYSLETGDGFRLQEAPKSRKSSMRSNNGPTLTDTESTGEQTTPVLGHTRNASYTINTPDSGINPFDDPKLRENKLPVRGDSLAATARKPIPTSHDWDTGSPSMPYSSHARSGSTTSSNYADATTYPLRTSGKPTESPLRSNMDIPPRAATRPSAPNNLNANDDFTAPRAPPALPQERDRRNESTSSLGGAAEMQMSPLRGHFQKNSFGGAVSIEDMRAAARNHSIGGDSSPSVLRRVSNAVRHGRSFSERTIPSSGHSKSASVGHVEISSPLNPSYPGSPTARDDVTQLKALLRRAQQRIAELEGEKIGLEDRANGSADIKQVNTELREKRSTMAFLDTQREMVVRELEVMTEHLTKAKNSNQPLDFSSLKSNVLQDFAQSLQKLKDQLGAQIEDLVHKRNELTDDIANLIQVKDKGLQEFESLSSKNHQLSELNAQLVHSIQEMYKANRVPSGTNIGLLNGLGIYTGSNKPSDPSLADTRTGSTSQMSTESPSTQNLMTEPSDLGEAHVLTAPQMVNIRKGQPKRFNWKKGSRDVAKNMTKGIKGAFGREGQYEGPNGIGMPYGTTQTGPSGLPSENGTMRNGPPSGGGLPFFNQKNGNLKPGSVGTTLRSGSSTNLAPAGTEPSVLFGSDLIARCEYEKRILPAVVTRCIEEVEARGMDIEGVYRKSGGSGQVKQIQMGFEKDGGSYDISDPDLDIHAVTSCLKQYFRKLPNPLITYDVYDQIMEAAEVQEPEKRAYSMKAAIGNLPPTHKDVLEYLVGHLVRVVQQESMNLMTTLNVAVVFAPTIMRPMSIEREMTDMMAQRESVRALLEHSNIIFD